MAENPGHPADDMSEFLQMFLDETEEQLDGLVETMLALEEDSTKKGELNEAFRLIHSIKGSAGMMGFDNIAILAHHLENRFERFRSGMERLDEPTMNVVLRCVDFLRQCNLRLRDGKRIESPVALLDELKRLEDRARVSDADESQHDVAAHLDEAADAAARPSPQTVAEHDSGDTRVRMVVRFRTALPLADLKAQLVVSRLSRLGHVESTEPDLHQLSDANGLEEFVVYLETQESQDALQTAADVEGVEAIVFEDAATDHGPWSPRKEGAADAISNPRGQKPPDDPPPATPLPSPKVSLSDADSGTHAVLLRPPDPSLEAAAELPRHADRPRPTATAKATAKVAETMRVDIDRLDVLMNLAGELVVNRARFVQISRQISPALRKSTMLNRIRDFRDGLKRTIERLEHDGKDATDRTALIQQLRAGMELMDEQGAIWENSRDCFGRITEAVDQLSRVSRSLQRSVLDTRMVPVGPLFHRFKRVVRDLSKERGKQVDLLIRGEKTELDKRMIDELGDPLVHLVRNSIDHGLEPPDVRIGRGKPAMGTIVLEASHQGNSVHIRVHDDGGGIDIPRIKARLIDRQLLSASAVAELADAQALEYIWHPGFSTAREVTDVSGRGVGMDVVKTRIDILNGTIEVDSTPQRGTSFTIRLPLTLAIINGLLVRLRNTIFSVPIDDVREIVSVNWSDVITINGKQTFEVRGSFVPLIHIEDVLPWHGIDYDGGVARGASSADANSRTIQVVILQASGNNIGLRVDELLGCQDVVIKSLADNFIHIRGLSGASILGDGSVCLMLDVGALIEMATRPTRAVDEEDAAI